jgi:hypothetical protein
VFRTEKRRNAETDQRYPWIVRSTTMVNLKTAMNRWCQEAKLAA